VSELEAALAWIANSPTGLDAQGDPIPHFVGEVGRAGGGRGGAGADARLSPTFLSPEEVAELGRAAIRTGLIPLARGALRRLGSGTRPEGGVPPLLLLGLVADWVAWTGDLELVAELGGALEEAMRRACIERPRDMGTLPDLLPKEESPTGLQSARIVRHWVDETLGARPDAKVGRLRLSPIVDAAPRVDPPPQSGTDPEWRSLEVEGVRMGDAAIRLLVRRGEGSIDFHLRQEAGRVPVNLVFEPRIRGCVVGEVRIGEAPAKVGRHSGTDPEGRDETLLRCQFPLDPERRLSIQVQPTG
jgi:hypothetical protein